MDQFNKPLLGSRIDPEHPLSKGLVLCLLMNENSGNRIYDISGNGNDGDFVANPLWNPGDRGQALAFDGISDYVSCGDVLNMGTGSFSIGAFGVKAHNSGVQGAQLIGKQVNYNLNQSGYGLYYRHFFPQFYFNVGDGVDGVRLTSLPTIVVTDEVYYNVICTFDGVSKTLNMYVDGVLVKTGSNVLIGDIDNGLHLRIGYSLVYFYGDISSSFIYNRALSAQEIQKLYINPYCFIYQPNKYWLTTPLRSAVDKFTAEHIDTHFIAEPIETHFIAEHL